MAVQKDSPAEGALNWLNGVKPICWACKHDRWDFLGIVFSRLFPNGDPGPSQPSPTARFVCQRCHVVFEVDCASAGLPTTPKQ